MTATYAYDARNRLTTLNHASGGTTLRGWAYQLDDNGTITKKTLTESGSATDVWSYKYDGRGRLTSAQETGGSHYKYVYDDGDNLLTKETWSYGGGLPILDARDTFGYNNANEQTSMNLDSLGPPRPPSTPGAA